MNNGLAPLLELFVRGICAARKSFFVCLLNWAATLLHVQKSIVAPFQNFVRIFINLFNLLIKFCKLPKKNNFYKTFFVCLIYLISSSTTQALSIGELVTNTAELGFERNGQTFSAQSNTVQHRLNTKPTTAEIQFYFGSSNSNIQGTCSNNDPAVSNIDDATSSYHAGNTTYVQVNDGDQNTDPNTAQTITVTVSSQNSNNAQIDIEELVATESGANTGIFIAALPTSLTNKTNNDCELGVEFNSEITASYTDARNAENNNLNIITSDTALVDPFGTVFDSNTGEPINEAIVTIYNANPDGSLGSPATVFADAAGTVSWPNSTTTGTPITDGNGNVITLGDGEYWFPFLAPGNYIIEVITNADYNFGPSANDATAISNNSNTNSYVIDDNGSYQLSFTIPENATPVRIDIPKDPNTTVGSGLVLTKETNSDFVGIGELVEYTLTIEVKESTAAHTNVEITDVLPRGLRFVKDSASSENIANLQQPAISSNARELKFFVGTVTANAPVTIKYLAKVGINTLPGTAINTAIAQDGLGNVSNNSQASIQIKDDLYQYSNQIIGQINVDSCGQPNSHEQKYHAIKITPVSISKDIIEYQIYTKNIRSVDKQAELIIKLDDALNLIEESIKADEKTLNAEKNKNSWIISLRKANNDDANISFKAKIMNTQQKPLTAKVTANFTALKQRVDITNSAIIENYSLKDRQAFHLKNTHKPTLHEFASNQAIKSRSHQKTAHNLDLSGIRIVMEDGRYAITDKDGKFHLDDVSKGAHVVQLDKFSLPRGLEVISCVNNTRFANRNFSQFVDMQGGTLWRTDFYVRTTETHAANAKQTTSTIKEADLQNVQTPRTQIETSQALEKITKKYSKAWLAQQANEFKLHEPHLNHSSLPFTNIILQFPIGQKIEVELNNKAVNQATLSKVIRSKDNNQQLAIWAGVHLEDGKNEINAVLKNNAGQEIGRVNKTIHVANEISNIELVPEKSKLIADGRTPPVIAVRFTSSGGTPIQKDLTGKYSINEPYIAYTKEQEDLKNNLILDRDIEPRFTIENDGIAYIQLEPTTQTGLVSLSFPINGQEKVIETWLKPELRDWILVALAEGSIVDSKIKSHMEELSEKDLKDSYQKDGRIAFYAKGKIKGKWLMTIAYDTDKAAKRRIERESIDPDLYFTLYGDNSAQYKDAVSSKKLFLKVENEQLYALFGDYSTNMNKTELSKYNRSFTGFKSEGNFKHFSYTAFTAKEDSTFQKDEINGDGTSGPYKLTQSDILINSEKISIETRDRNNQSIILKTETLRRYIDYNVDYYTGRLTFKNIVPTTDINFNPVYIVVDYELNTFTEGDRTSGARVAYHTNNKSLEAGVSYIKQKSVNEKGEIAAVDITIKPNDQHEVTIEAARTDNDESDNNANAYLAKYKYTREDLTVDARASKHEKEFGLEQQASTASNIEQYQVKATKKVNNKLTIQASADHQERLDSDEAQQTFGARASFKHKNGSSHIGYRQTKNTDIANNDSTYDIAEIGVQQRIGKLNAYARAETTLNNDENDDKAQRISVGADYDLFENFAMFAKTEITDIGKQSARRKQIGVKYKPWNGAEISTAVNRETEDGQSQDYANYAFTQRYAITENTRTDFSYEEGRSLNLDQTPFDGLDSNPTTPSEDYRSMSLGLHTHREEWSLQNRIEHRASDNEDRLGILSRWYRREHKGIAYGVRTEAYKTDDKKNKTDSTEAETELSLVYRPLDTRWTLLNRLKLAYNDKKGSTDVTTRKVVNHFRGNYIYDDKNQVSLAYGAKHILQDFQDRSDSNTLHFVASEYRHDINEDWDVGLRASGLYDQDSKSSKYMTGVSLGYSFATNVWISAGYNFAGFKDQDFDELTNNNQGWQLDLRIKADQETIRSINSSQDDKKKNKE